MRVFVFAASAVTISLGMVVGCTPPEGRPLGHRVAYELAWDTAGVDLDAEGWTVTNDLGYRVQVTQGYLSTYSVAFLPCDDDPAAKVPPVSGTLWDLLGVRRAHAGPASVAMNPAMLVPGHIESLTEPRLRKTLTLRPPPTRFCRVHYLVARAEPDAAEMPREHRMTGISLYVTGFWSAAEGGEPVPFTIETKAANGVAQPVVRASTGEPFEADSAKGRATATVTRKLATLFDGVDFSAMSDKQASWELLKRVIEGTEIRVRTREAA